MRKLILTSIIEKAGDQEWQEDRLVVVNQEPDDVEEDLLKKAEAHVMRWLSTRPQSESVRIIPKATIGESATEEPKKDIEVYTRNGLLQFGNYLLSEERENRMKSFYKEAGIEFGPNWETALCVAKIEDIDHWKSTFQKG